METWKMLLSRGWGRITFTFLSKRKGLQENAHDFFLFDQTTQFLLVLVLELTLLEVICIGHHHREVLKSLIVHKFIR